MPSQMSAYRQAEAVQAGWRWSETWHSWLCAEGHVVPDRQVSENPRAACWLCRCEAAERAQPERASVIRARRDEVERLRREEREANMRRHAEALVAEDVIILDEPLPTDDDRVAARQRAVDEIMRRMTGRRQRTNEPEPSLRPACGRRYTFEE